MKKTADEVCVPVKTSISLVNMEAGVELCALGLRGSHHLRVPLVVTRQKLRDFGSFCLCFMISRMDRAVKTGDGGGPQHLIFSSLIINGVHHTDTHRHLYNCSESWGPDQDIIVQIIH